MKNGEIRDRDRCSQACLSGCTVGPNYHRPAVQTPNAFRDLADNPQLQAQAASYADLPLVAGIPGSETAGTHPHGA